MANYKNSFRFDYVFIIEFLGPGERLTGTELHQEFESDGTFVAQLVTCRNKRDVLNALAKAAREVPEKGIPIVHFEAHGDSSGLGGGRRSPQLCAQSDEYVITWTTLWAALREINIATNFNLLVFGAACFGDEVSRGLIDFSTGDFAVAPFMAAVGFSAEVSTAELFDATATLYSALYASRNLERAVIDANEGLVGEAKLSLTWTIQVLEGVVKSLDSVDVSFFRERALLDDPNFDQSDDQIITNAGSWQKLALEIALGKILSYSTHPHNRLRFVG